MINKQGYRLLLLLVCKFGLNKIKLLYFFYRGSDSHPPGGFLNFLKKNTSSHAQVVSNGSSSQPINIGDDTNGGDIARTEKRLTWTKEEDLKLVKKNRLHSYLHVLDC